MLISYIPDDQLSDFNLANLDPTLRSHLYAQLAGIFIQLRHCKFPHIASLTLDPADNQTPIFAHNRPLSIDINDYEVGGLNAANIIGPNRIFTTAIDYLYTQTQLVFNQFEHNVSRRVEKDDASYSHQRQASRQLQEFAQQARRRRRNCVVDLASGCKAGYQYDQLDVDHL